MPPEDIPGATDDALVRATLAGQKDAFTELVRRYTKMVMWHVSGWVSDETEVEEIAQEAVVRSYVNLARLRAPGAFARWLIVISDSIIRAKHKMDSRIINIGMADGAVEAQPQPAPVEALSDEELRGKLVVEMRRLPSHYRTVLALKYMQGFSVDEIAERLVVPTGTVRSRLSRAYAILHKRLEGPAAPGPAGAAQADTGHQTEEV